MLGSEDGGRRVPTSAIAAVGLVLAFGVAQVTQARPVGGGVLVAAALWCVLREARHTAWWRLVVVVLVAVVCFIASHRLDDVLGAWPAVLLAAAVLGAVTFAMVDLPARRRRLSRVAGAATAAGR